MNLILITEKEKEQGLPREDRRSVHIQKILKKGTGSHLFVGILNDERIWQVTLSQKIDKIFFENWQEVARANPPCSLTLILALSRPLVMKRLLKDASCLGVKAIHLFSSDLGEKSYLNSSLWKGEHLELLLEGAMQAKSTYVPSFSIHKNLKNLLPHFKKKQASHKWILHPQQSAPHLLKQNLPSTAEVCLAIGCERGWSSQEIQLFKQENFQVLHMGPRILRTETATIASLYWIREQLQTS